MTEKEFFKKFDEHMDLEKEPVAEKMEIEFEPGWQERFIGHMLGIVIKNIEVGEGYKIYDKIEKKRYCRYAESHLASFLSYMYNNILITDPDTYQGIITTILKEAYMKERGDKKNGN